MKMQARLMSLLSAALLLASCGGDPYMDGPIYPGGGGYNPGGHGGSGGSGGSGGDGGGGTTMNFVVNKNWTVTYNGRENYDGAEVDRIVVKSTDNNSYYIDVIAKASFDGDFKGSLNDYCTAVRDNLAADVKAGNAKWSDLLGTKESYILFDRLRAGEWKAFAIGFDSKGSLTGQYAVLDFTIREEKPSEAFNRWLGTWKLSGSNGGTGTVSYEIVLSSSESNHAYWLSGWEPNDDYNYEFEVFFNNENGQIEINSLYFGLENFEGEDSQTHDFEVLLNGNLVAGDNVYAVNREGPIADGWITSEDGSNARIEGCYAEDVEISRGVKISDYYSSMQIMYYALDSSGQAYLDATWNPMMLSSIQTVPHFPLTLEWISASTSTKAETKASSTVRLSAPRQAVRHGTQKRTRSVMLNKNVVR